MWTKARVTPLDNIIFVACWVILKYFILYLEFMVINKGW